MTLNKIFSRNSFYIVVLYVNKIAADLLISHSTYVLYEKHRLIQFVKKSLFKFLKNKIKECEKKFYSVLITQLSSS